MVLHLTPPYAGFLLHLPVKSFIITDFTAELIWRDHNPSPTKMKARSVPFSNTWHISTLAACMIPDYWTCDRLISFARLLSFLSVMMHCTLIVRKRDGEQLRVRQWNYWFVGSEVWTVLQQSWHRCKMTFEICHHYKNVLWSVGNTLGTIDVEWRRRTVLTGVWRAFVFELSICINTRGSMM